MRPEELKDWLNTHLELIDHHEMKGCIRVNDIEMKPLTDQTIVIVSDIYRATLTLEMKDGTTKRIKTVAKFEPAPEGGFSQMAKDFNLCITEIMVYKEILKKMEELVQSCQISSNMDRIWSQCYLCENNTFIFEDLTESGYRIVPTQEMLDVKHAVLALDAIGKYHGMGLVLREQNKLDMSKIPPTFISKNENLINNMFRTSITTLAEVIDTEWEDKWKGVPDKLRRAVDNVGEKLKDLYDSSAGNCEVLCHGDFTMRNMLFHYQQDNKTPDKVKLIDFQAANWSHFCFDLVAFLCCSLMPQEIEENLNELLSAYSDSLMKTCSMYKYKGYIPTFDDVKRDYHSFGYYSLLFTVFSIPAFLAEKGDFEADKLLLENDKEEGHSSFKASHFRNKRVHDALQFELERCLKLNIL